MIAAHFPESNVTLALGQEQYEPVYAHFMPGHPEGRVTCCFRLSDAEVDEIVRTRTLWYAQLTFGHTFQPVLLCTQKPEDL
jgi:hypothetical protein